MVKTAAGASAPPSTGVASRRSTRFALALLLAGIIGAFLAGTGPLRTSAATPVNWSTWSPQTASADCTAQSAGCPGPMTVPRQGFTATVLAGPACQTASPPSYCGKVLIVGGDAAFSGTSAELYDPATGAWTATGSMTAARSGETATALLGPECQSASPPAYCGKVLVAGGAATASLPSAELYDPATGLWSTTGSMTNPRSSHTATLLTGAVCHASPVPGWCGKVLIAGGSPVSTADIYDPATGTWTQGGAMATPRVEHTATQLDAPQCGAASPPPWCGRVVAAGGRPVNSSGPIWLSSAEVYDPTTGVWTTTGSLSGPRFDHTATLLSGPACAGASPPAYCGKVMVAGGAGQNFSDLPQAELYDASTGTWSVSGSLNQARRRHTAALLRNGEVLVAGGADPGSADQSLRPIGSAELYNPATAVWSQTGSLTSPRAFNAMALLNNGTVLTMGGCCGQTTNPLQSSELYTPADPAVYVTPSSLAFGRAEVGFATASQQVTVSNGGTLPLTVSSVGTAGANPADFRVTADGCSTAPVAPSSNCTIGVAFTPTAPGTRTAHLSIADNGAGSPRTVALSGTGESALLAVTGSDGQLWARQDAGPYTALGGRLIGAPTVVAVPGASGTVPTPLYLGIGTDHNVYVRTTSQPWQALSATPAYCLDAVGAAVTGTPGTLTLTVGCEGGDSALYYAQGPLPSTGLPAVTTWTSLGGALSAGPAVVVIGGRVTFFVTGSNGTVWVRDTSGTGYVAMQYACNSRPAVAAAGSTLYFACQGGDGALWYAVNTGVGWPAATSAGGHLVGGAGIAATTTQALIYVEGTDSGVYQIAVTPPGAATPFVRDGGAVQNGAAAAGLVP